MDIIDPYSIPFEKMPIITLVDDRRGWLGFLIKNHTAGQYNHVMELNRPGYFASQNPGGYKEKPIHKYKKPFNILKFWHYKTATVSMRTEWADTIAKDLKDPKNAKYDILGLIGQFLHIPWLNDPNSRYCSEMVGEHLSKLGLDIPKHPTPSDLNFLFTCMDDMECLGYYIMD